ncbi:MAG: dihydrofolate reductase [Lachnospiraceae bacterium]|jgi:dihydrofolate reductase|nr:dihydrofolate reductase [Lachnospiraceae bacterium]
MNIIAAVDKNWAIGNKGDLLIRIPADHRFFQSETMGKVVVLGRKTLATFPGGQPLKGRTNIILSHNHDLQVKGAHIVHDLESLLEELAKYPREDIFIIGGESVYRLMLPYCDTAHITMIDYTYDADSYFPDLDSLPEWKITGDSEEQTYFDVSYYFLCYQRV